MNFLEKNGMNPQQLALYQKIQGFALDKPNVYFTYSQRLARDHQWSSNYTQRVIEEYKKFLFLAITTSHPVTPSVAVDEAWHLHLTYTFSYWDELCGQVLGKPLHHHPTEGGQKQLFENYYVQTLESYQQFFGYPPDDIWPSPTHRFNPTEKIRQINQRDYWLISKPSLISLSQILGRFFQNLWLKKILAFLLMLGLVASLSPAMAQVYSSSDQINLFKILQQSLLDHPFAVFCFFVSVICFLIGFILSLKPIFIQPVGRTRVINNNSVVDDALTVSAFLISVLFYSFFDFDFDPVGFEAMLYLLCFFLLSGGIYSIEIALIKFLTKRQGQSLRPLSCINCRKKLILLTYPENFLTHQEEVAMNIGSTNFEAWHCQSCFSEINRQSIHLRVYRNISDRFDVCSVCQEVTMTKSNSRILRKATHETEGRKLITYTCQCCHKEEKKGQIISRISECAGCW